MLLRILSERDVRAVITMAEAIELQRDAFSMLTEGRSIEGLRSFAVSERPRGMTIFNPSYLTDGKGFGVKVISEFRANSAKGLADMTALVALFDGITGQPSTVMDATYLTDLRTGASTALAARYLARADSRTLAMIGAGRVARNQLWALCEVLPIDRVRLSTRSDRRAHQFMARMAAMGGRIPKAIELVESRAAAVREADVVICATGAHEPVFPGSALGPGTFVAAVGANRATNREVDSETIRRAATWVVDSPVDCLANAGDLVIPIAEGILRREQIAGMADVAAGRRPGRQADADITFYKSMGVPIQDLITAQHIERRAIERSIGTTIEIGGDHD